MPDSIDRITDAVLAVPGVIGLAADPDADLTAGSADGPTTGVSTDGPSTTVHVQIAAQAPARVTVQRVQQATHDITGGRVDVTIEEIC